MSARHVVDMPATTAGLNAALEAAPPHLRPVIQAVRDCRVGMLFVPQGPEPFRLPKEPARPAIVIIGDDFDRADGPDGFHLPSIRRAIRDACSFAVVSCAPPPEVYASIALTAAVTRKNTMLIETRPEKEIPWLALIQKLAPRRHIWLATVKGGRA